MKKRLDKKSLIISGIFLVLFILVLIFLDSVSSIDSYVHLLVNHNTYFFDLFFFAFTFVFETTSAIFISLMLFGILYIQERKKAVLFSILTIGGAGVLVESIKIIVGRTRPVVQHFITETGPSFPSGHAVISTVFMLLIFFLFSYKFKTRHGKIIFGVVCGMIALLVSFSRLYFGVHWFSDIIAGILLGLGWFALMYSYFKKSIRQ